MATVTIRGLPDELVARMKAAAALNGRSMEQEVRLALADRYRERELVLERVRNRWPDPPRVTAAEIDAWIETGRSEPER